MIDLTVAQIAEPTCRQNRLSTTWTPRVAAHFTPANMIARSSAVTRRSPMPSIGRWSIGRSVARGTVSRIAGWASRFAGLARYGYCITYIIHL